jgi:hypothetical protein
MLQTDFISFFLATNIEQLPINGQEILDLSSIEVFGFLPFYPFRYLIKQQAVISR